MLGRRFLGRAAATALAACCALLLTATGAAAAPADAWTSETGGGGNSHTNPGETVLTPANGGRLALAWQDGAYGVALAAPTVVDGSLYRIVNTGNVSRPSTLEVRSVRTGALQWSMQLPGNAHYYHGVTVVPSAQRLVASWIGHDRPGGVLAVDLARRAVAWQRSLPAPLRAGTGNFAPGPVLADAQRVYTSGADRAVLTYRLSDGAPLWSLPVPRDPQGRALVQHGLALANGVLYRSDDGGLTAHAAAGGRALWTEIGRTHV